MKKILIIALVLAMAGCKTYQASSESNKTDIERSERNERDSIYIRDSVIVFARADTVYKERWRTEYKDRVVTKTDTLVREVERLVEKVVTDDGLRVTGRKRGIGYWIRVTGYGILVILILAAIAATIIRVRRLF